MNYREARGQEIALSGRLKKTGDHWLIRSRSQIGATYKIRIHDNQETCTCPDFTTYRRRCKHIYAVIFQTDFPQSKLTDPPPIRRERAQKTYPRDWSQYNFCQTNEKPMFMRLLKGLCETVVVEQSTKGRGRPSIPLADLAFLMCYKVYEGFSTRRFMSDAQVAYRSGYVSCEPHFNKVIQAMSDERMTEILLHFIKMSSLPLRPIERHFAADSSGFTRLKYEKYINIRHSEKQDRHMWTKVHLMCGVVTHIVTAVVIKDMHAADPNQLPELIKKTAENFDMRELYADKIYATLDNYDVIAEEGILPYIAFKMSHTGSGKGRTGKHHLTDGGKLWQKMYHLSAYHLDEFLAHYNDRNNVESVFSMAKAKFGGDVLSRSETASLNEVLCKFVCHNIYCLIHAMLRFEHVNVEALFPSQPPVPNFTVIEGGKAHQRRMS